MNSLPKTVTRHRRGCDLNPGLSAPESSTLTTRLPSHPTSTNEGQGAVIFHENELLRCVVVIVRARSFRARQLRRESISRCRFVRTTAVGVGISRRGD